MRISPFISATLFAICATGAQAATINSAINVDNAFTAFISTNNNTAGTAFSSGSNWPTTVLGSAMLTDGVTNYLHIEADDLGGVAGFLGSFSLSGTGFAFANGLQTLKTGEGYFMQSTTGWSGYTAVSQYGTNGEAPWSLRPGNDAAAIWIWSGNNNTDNKVYFTAAINAVTPVPVPASLPLLVAGLGVLGLARKRRS